MDVGEALRQVEEAAGTQDLMGIQHAATEGAASSLSRSCDHDDVARQQRDSEADAGADLRQVEEATGAQQVMGIQHEVTEGAAE